MGSEGKVSKMRDAPAFYTEVLRAWRASVGLIQGVRQLRLLRVTRRKEVRKTGRALILNEAVFILPCVSKNLIFTRRLSNRAMSQLSHLILDM